jgi:hypothetical protein
MPSPRSWVVVYDPSHPTMPGHCHCQRCGAHSVVLAPGMAVTDACAIMRRFGVDHAYCRPAPAITDPTPAIGGRANG